MSQYKNWIFGVVLTLVTVVVTLSVSNLLEHRSGQLTYDIVGPSTASIGKFARYNMSVENLSWWAKKPIWQWSLVEASNGETELETNPNGVIFVPDVNSTQYYLISSGTVYYNYILWGKTQPLGIIVKTVSVNNANPNPPTPNPTPDPTIPDGKYGVASISYQLFNKISYSNKSALAKSISSNYSGVSSAIRAGAITTLEDLFKIIKSKNQSTLTSLNAPSSIFSDWAGGIQQKIYDLYTAKKLSKLNDFADFFDEVSLGLNNVK